MKKSLVVTAGIIAFAGGSVGIARSQATPPASMATTAPMAPMAPMAMPAMPPDASFIRAVTQSNDAEVEAARYVLQSTKNAGIRDFATQMIADHSTANVRMQVAARNANQPLPQRDASGKPPDVLSSVSGPQRDAAYLNQQVSAHRTALDVLNAYAAKGKNPALVTYATALVPSVQAHLAKAQMLVAALPPPTRAPAASASVAPIPAGGVPGNTNPNGGSMVPPASPSPQGSGSPNPQPSVGIPNTPRPAVSSSPRP